MKLKIFFLSVKQRTVAKHRTMSGSRVFTNKYGSSEWNSWKDL